MKGIILFKSRYGNTRQYAKWLAEDLNFELRDFSKFKKKEIANYDQIIFGSGVYMNKMDKIQKVLKMFRDKPIVIFSCAGNPGIEKEIEDIKMYNFHHDELSFHHFFYLPGGVDFSKVTGFMKFLINIFRKILEKKKNKTYEEEQILKGFTDPTHYVDRKHIKKIVEFIHQT